MIDHPLSESIELLAHWRHRMDMLNRKLSCTYEALQRINEMVRQEQSAFVPEACTREEFHEAMKRPTMFDSDRDEIEKQSEYECWLLEEARYNAELWQIVLSVKVEKHAT